MCDLTRTQYVDRVLGEERPNSVNFRRVLWPAHPSALVIYTTTNEGIILTALHRGEKLSGTEVLSIFRDHIARDRRIQVVGVDPDVLGFWEKMLARKLIDGFNTQSVESFLAER